MPAAERRALHQRRGGTAVSSREIDKDATAIVRSWTVGLESTLRILLAQRGRSPSWPSVEAPVWTVNRIREARPARKLVTIDRTFRDRETVGPVDLGIPVIAEMQD